MDSDSSLIKAGVQLQVLKILKLLIGRGRA